MRNKRLPMLIMVLLAVVLTSSATVSAQDGTIVEVVTNNDDFSILAGMIEVAGLADTLSGDGSFTLFAPTNDAFMTLPEAVHEYVLAHPELLTRILTYHVLPNAVMSSDVSSMTATTVEGSDLTIVVHDSGGVTVDQASVTSTDMVASNGVIHTIDSVLVPPIALPEVDPSTVTGDIITAGSSTVGPITIAIANQFFSGGYADNIEIEIIGTGGGFTRFCEAGDSDISNASRPINADEIQACNAIGREPIEFRVGTDALAVVINPDNDAITSLTMEELALAFSTAETWSDVNPRFPDEEILRFAPGQDSGTFDFFVEEVFDEDTTPILDAPNIVFSEDDNFLLEQVANEPWAIGFFGYAYFQENRDILSVLDIEDVTPNQANVDSATYPLARPLFIYSDATIITEQPQVGQFISFYLSNVDAVIQEVGYFPANAFELNVSRLVIMALSDL